MILYIIFVGWCLPVQTLNHNLLVVEEMVLFRTRNGSIPRFIYGTPKWFYI